MHFLKENLPDALEHDCAGCSEVQKNAADKISHHLIDNKPDDWKLMEDKYDPTGAYRRRYLENKPKENSRVDWNRWFSRVVRTRDLYNADQAILWTWLLIVILVTRQFHFT